MPLQFFVLFLVLDAIVYIPLRQSARQLPIAAIQLGGTDCGSQTT
jgi:hypothetical protein